MMKNIFGLALDTELSASPKFIKAKALLRLRGESISGDTEILSHTQLLHAG